MSSNKTNTKKRYAAERRFKLYGKLAIGLAFAFILILLVNILTKGVGGFSQTKITLDVPAGFETTSNARKDFKNILKYNYPDKSSRELRKLGKAFSSNAGYEVATQLEQATTQTVKVTAASDVDLYYKQSADISLPDIQLELVNNLKQKNAINTQFNKDFFTLGDSRNPEKAGMMASFVGSLFTILACLCLALPLGIATAIYLQEFAPKNRFTEILEININNLAAVPSIVYGLLGLSVYINFMDLPRSAALVGGLTLALLILPVIIIATRTALKSVPDSIRKAALGLGASPMQVVFHHTLPLAMPGIMTGTILGVARALGETAPLIMIGMVAFIPEIASSWLDPSTVLPVQIYQWTKMAETGFIEKTSAAIIILLLLLILLNLVAVYIRNKFERRW